MISPQDLFSFVIKNMIEKKGRVFLTVSGIIIGIFTFTFFVFASQGLSNAITEQFSSFGTNILGVSRVDSQSSNGPPQGNGMTDTDIAKIRQVTSDVKYIAPGIFFSSGQYEYGREKEVIVSLGYPDENWKDIVEELGIEIEEGRFLRTGDSGAVVIGAKTAKDTYKKELTIGSSLKVNGESFRVVGIIKERGDLFVDNSLLMPFEDIKKVADQDTYTLVRVSFLDNADLQENKEAIERKLNPNNKEKTVEITSPDQIIDQFNSIIGILQMIIGFVSSIALVVGGINVMNTMYSNILERINEISVMKAMGATNPDIRNLFLFESYLLGFFGAFIGFILSYGIAELLSYLITNFAGYNVPVYFSISFFAEVLLITSIFAMLFGTYPAIRAARVNPADNLRDE